ncbi:dnsH [Acrasis kona]|uniref:DnsH n=1 Tax=Acrasis kona TaxID=1008807 RepID=A0AAW2YU16_9EUKA
MRAPLYCLCLLLLVCLVIAESYYDEERDLQDRNIYYNTNGDNFQTDYKKLSDLLVKTHSHRTDYGEARGHLYPTIDRYPDDSLKCVYSQKLLESDNKAAAGGVRIMVRGGSNPTYNCEHSMPQSWFNKQLPMKGDIHHLFTAETRCNGFRGNLPFGHYDTKKGDRALKEMAGCGIMFDRDGVKSFFPLYGRGAVARAVLYFITRYPGEIEHGNIPESHLEDIKQWAKDYPAERWEQHRNRYIYEVQGNRNPYIDFPTLVSEIDFSGALSN